MIILSYDTESKSRNVLASPLGEEGHEVAKGVQANWIHRGAPRPANPVRRHPAKSVCTRVRMIMILDVDVTAERRHYNTHRPAGDTTTLGAKGPVKLKNPWAEGPSILRTFPSEPSHRRCVQSAPWQIPFPFSSLSCYNKNIKVYIHSTGRCRFYIKEIFPCFWDRYRDCL